MEQSINQPKEDTIELDDQNIKKLVGTTSEENNLKKTLGDGNESQKFNNEANNENSIILEKQTSDSESKATFPVPQNLICPEPLSPVLANDKNDLGSGSMFNPILHQPRRDMYGGNSRKGIPKGFQHILYDVSNAVIKENNYGATDSETKRVFRDKYAIYHYIAEHLGSRLMQRKDVNGEKTCK